MLGKRSLARAVQSTRATPYLVFLPVVRLDEVPLVTLFLPGAAFLPGATFLAATAFLAPPSRELAAIVRLVAFVAPEVAGALGADGTRRPLATTLSTPGPGMMLVSPPESHRTLIMTPFMPVTTPERGTPLDVTAIRSPTCAISISSKGG